MKKLLRLISVATILLAATSFMACSSDDDDDDSGARSVSARTSGSVVGVVLDNKGAPVEGATVTLGGKTAKTNYGGEFEITGVNPNDSKLIKAAKTVTTTSTESTKAGTGASATPTETSHSTTSTTGDGTASSDVLPPTSGSSTKTTGYTLTVKKDGYLPGTITGIYVTYQDTEDPEVTRANALLHGLEFDYQDILDRYAGALTNVTANNGNTATTTTTATEDTTATTTVQTGSNADRVFKDISEAISALKSLYKTGSYTEYFSDFGTSSALIPLDASLKGSLKLNLTSKEGTTWAETTYKPTSKPTIHVSYGATDKADYTWSAQANAEGIFEFKENLPSGVPLTISVDSFQETIESNDYWFSSDSMIVLVDNSGAEEPSTGVKTVTLDSKDVNHETYRFLLFAQNDKLWVTKTNTETTASGVLLSKNSNLTFTFNKPVKKVDIVIGTTSEPKTTGFNNLSKDSYDAKISEDGKTVTFTPKLGYWDLDTSKASQVVLTAEAVDGTTKLEKTVFPVYFDNKVWVSVKDLSYDDYNDLRKLSDPIVLVFSKPMNEKIAVNLSNNKTAYTEKWNEADADKGIEANTELTLTPDAKVGYWDIGSNTTIDITVTKDFANSKDSYIDEFGYWKVGAVKSTTTSTTEDALRVNFDNYNDVTIAKADKGFTATFAKAIKAQTESELKANLNVYNVGASYAEKFDYAATGVEVVSDVIFALSDDGTKITVTPQNTEFAKYGYYALHFNKDKFVAKTGEKILRKPATTKTVEGQYLETTTTETPFVTTFTLGTEFKYTDVKVVEKLPETAIASRAIYVDNDKYLQITFNKAVRTSELKIDSKTVTNYIDGNDVYLPLATLADNTDVKLAGDVWSKDGQKWELGNVKNATVFDTLFKVNKLSYKMVETSLYTVKKAIADGAAGSAGNNAVVNKIAPADTTITFTFDQNVESATWTAEFYDTNNVSVKNLDQTPYVATAVAAGKVVTVTLSGKERDFNKTYYLSLKATKGTGDDVVVLYDSSTATNTSYGTLPGSTDTLNTVITNTANSKTYIKVVTKTEDEVAGLDNLYVVEESINSASATTKLADFAKSNTSPIVLEFSEDITAIVDPNEVYLANGDNGSGNPASLPNWATKAAVDKTKTYAAKATVAGKVLTISPTYAFPSKSKVYPIVFNKDGKRLDLKKVTDTNTATFANTAYESAELDWSNSSKANAATNELFGKTTSAKLVVANFDKDNVGNGSKLYFSFAPIYSETNVTATADYGEYTLYKKVKGINDASAVWKKLSTYKVGSGLSYVDLSKPETVADKETETARVKSVKTATNNAFALGGYAACIQTTADADEFNFSKTADYKVVCTIDNVEIHSDVVTVTDEKVYVELVTAASDANSKTALTGSTGTNAFDKTNTLNITNATDAETAWTDKEFKVFGSGYIKSVTPKLAKGAVNVSDANKDGRIGGNATVEAEAVDDNTWKVTVKPKAGSSVTDVFAAVGDTVTLDVTDAKDVKTTYVIKFIKQN